MIALSVLLVLSFLNPEMRRKPILVAESFARGGVTFGRLLMAIGTVSIIIAVLGATGLPLEFAKVISSNAGQNLLLALIFAAVAALILGMGMPTLPAYLTIIIILGPSLTSLGLTDLTAHFFVFYFGVASAITPPVAMAAFAAASISGGGAIGTAVQATRIGIVIFAIPFFFAFNPQMLIVDAAGGLFTVGGFAFLLLRLALLIYMLASAASRFDRGRMPAWEGCRAGGGRALFDSPVRDGQRHCGPGLPCLDCIALRSANSERGRKLSERPNILYFMTDQHRADWLGCAGHPVVKTPNIDGIAARGTRFTNFYVTSPVCMPNRGAIFTGRYPSVNGLRHNGLPLPADANTFVDVLRAGGYHTASIGKSHLQPFTDKPIKREDESHVANPDVPEAHKPNGIRYESEHPNSYEGTEYHVLPVPYYGFDHVRMVTNHSDECGGHYLQWLRRQTSKWAFHQRSQEPVPA